jgi:hypothetical protein
MQCRREITEQPPTTALEIGIPFASRLLRSWWARKAVLRGLGSDSSAAGNMSTNEVDKVRLSHGVNI